MVSKLVIILIPPDLYVPQEVISAFEKMEVSVEIVRLSKDPTTRTIVLPDPPQKNEEHYIGNDAFGNYQLRQAYEDGRTLFRFQGSKGRVTIIRFPIATDLALFAQKLGNSEIYFFGILNKTDFFELLDRALGTTVGSKIQYMFGNSKKTIRYMPSFTLEQLAKAEIAERIGWTGE